MNSYLVPSEEFPTWYIQLSDEKQIKTLEVLRLIASELGISAGIEVVATQDALNLKPLLPSMFSFN